MKKVIYSIYSAWVILAVLSKILLGASWWIALSWLWLPLGVIVTLAFAVALSVKIGNVLKAKEDAKIPDTCENCLFGRTAEFTEDKKCLNETLGGTRGKVCSHFRKFTD